MGNDPQKEQEFINLIGQDRKQAQKIIQDLHGHSKEAQFIVDLADQILNVTQYGIPPNIDLDHQLTAWKYVNVQQGQVIEAISVMPTDISSNAVAFSSTALINPSNIIPFIPQDKKDEIMLYVQRLSQVIERQADRTKVIDHLNRLNLNASKKGGKTPKELFENAWEAFDNGSPEITSLIPMREAIEMVITILLQRRSFPDKAKNWVEKIHSILNQLALDNLPITAISSLSNRWTNLQRELSSSKQKHMTRPECRDILLRATLFLLELLESIDTSKMRQ